MCDFYVSNENQKENQLENFYTLKSEPKYDANLAFNQSKHKTQITSTVKQLKERKKNKSKYFRSADFCARGKQAGRGRQNEHYKMDEFHIVSHMCVLSGTNQRLRCDHIQTTRTSE